MVVSSIVMRVVLVAGQEPVMVATTLTTVVGDPFGYNSVEQNAEPVASLERTP